MTTKIKSSNLDSNLVISGTLTANNIIAVVEGNADTATALETPRTITIGSTGKTFDGSANVSWALNEIGVGTLGEQNANNAVITGGSIDGTTIGASSASTGAFTTLSATGIISASQFQTALSTSAFVAGSFSGPTNSAVFGPAGSTGGAAIFARSGTDTNTFIDFNAPDVSASGGTVNYRFGRGTTSAAGSRMQFFKHDGSSTTIFQVLDSGLTTFGNGTSEAMRITSTGRVGIGTTSPAVEFSVLGNAEISGYLALTNSTSPTLRAIKNGGGQDNLLFYNNTTSSNDLFVGRDSINLVLRTDGTERMRVTSSGNVGIGLTNPTQRLEVNGNQTLYGKFTAGDELGNPNLINTLDFNSNLGVAGFRSINLIDSAAGIKVSRPNDGNFGAFIELQEWDSTITTLKSRAMITAEQSNLLYRNLTEGSHIFQGVANVERMRIDSAGNVGIGTSSPSELLHLSSSAPNIFVNSSANGSATFDGRATNGGLLLTAATMNTTSKYTPAIMFGSTDPDFNTNTPRIGAAIIAEAAQTFTINETGSMHLSFWTRDGTLTADQNAQERMRVTNTGRVGIGTSSPATALDIRGAGADQSSIRLVSDDTKFSTVEFRTDGDSSRWFIGHRVAAGSLFSVGVYGSGSANSTGLVFRDTGGAAFGQTPPTGVPFSVASGGSELLRITSAGRVGIGTSSPDVNAILDIVDTNLQVRLLRGSAFNATDVSTGRGLYLSSANNSTDSTGQILNAIVFSGQGTGRRRAMIANLQSGASTTGGDIAFYNTASSAGNDVVAERMRITGAGNVGIGATPDAFTRLLVQESSSSRSWSSSAGNSVLLVERNGNSGITISAAATSTSSLNFSSPTDENAGIIAYSHSDDAMTFRTNGTGENMRIDSSGNVGIGTSSPNAPLEVFGAGSPSTRTAIIRSTGVAGIHIQSESNFSRNILFQDNNGDQNSRILALGTLEGNSAELRLVAGTFMRFDANGSERMRINSAGLVGIGINAPTSLLHLRGTGDVLRLDTSGGEDQDGVALRFHQRDTTIVSGQGYGGIEWEGSDTSNAGVRGYIKGFAEGTTGQFGLAFATQGSGASSPVERMRISNAGFVGIGTNNPSRALHVVTDLTLPVRVESTGASSYIDFVDAGTSGGTFRNRFGSSGNDLALWTSATERMRIDSAGNVGIGTSAPGANAKLDVIGNITIDSAFSNDVGLCFRRGFEASDNCRIYTGDTGQGRKGGMRLTAFDGIAFGTGSNDWSERMRIDLFGRTHFGGDYTTVLNGFGGENVSKLFISGGSAQYVAINGASGNAPLYISHSASSTASALINFADTGVTVGSITTNGSTTAFNTSSDYRLKENVVPLIGAADRLMQIPVYRFNFINTPEKIVDGFLAHEAQTVVPEAVTGKKDQVEIVEIKDESGNVTSTEERPVYQGIDQSKLVPLLTAALQEALLKIDALEARLNNLENK